MSTDIFGTLPIAQTVKCKGDGRGTALALPMAVTEMSLPLLNIRIGGTRLNPSHKRRFKRTTDSEHASPVAPNLFATDIAAYGADRKWDVTLPSPGYRR